MYGVEPHCIRLSRITVISPLLLTVPLIGAPDRSQTCGLTRTRGMLYLLSYKGRMIYGMSIYYKLISPPNQLTIIIFSGGYSET